LLPAPHGREEKRDLYRVNWDVEPYYAMLYYTILPLKRKFLSSVTLLKTVDFATFGFFIIQWVLLTQLFIISVRVRLQNLTIAVQKQTYTVAVNCHIEFLKNIMK